MGNSFRQPYGLPPSRSVVPALLLFPHICCASAREPYILLPPSRHRSKLRMPRHLPEEEAIIRIPKNNFREQNHAFALRDSICLLPEAYCF